MIHTPEFVGSYWCNCCKHFQSGIQINTDIWLCTHETSEIWPPSWHAVWHWIQSFCSTCDSAFSSNSKWKRNDAKWQKGQVKVERSRKLTSRPITWVALLTHPPKVGTKLRCWDGLQLELVGQALASEKRKAMLWPNCRNLTLCGKGNIMCMVHSLSV